MFTMKCKATSYMSWHALNDVIDEVLKKHFPVLFHYMDGRKRLVCWRTWASRKTSFQGIDTFSI